MTARHQTRPDWRQRVHLRQLGALRGHDRSRAARAGTALRPREPHHAAHAHRWVRDGYLHNTGLYIDAGRIRKAKGE